MPAQMPAICSHAAVRPSQRVHRWLSSSRAKPATHRPQRLVPGSKPGPQVPGAPPGQAARAFSPPHRSTRLRKHAGSSGAHTRQTCADTQ